MYAIGIDLGTTNSCVAARVRGKNEVLENDNGNLTTPSCVAFTEEQTVIGESAKRLMAQEPKNTIYSVKRIIGRKFNDSKTQEDINRWQFKVESSGGRPVIKIDHRGETYNVEEISALVLDYMRQIACKRLDEDVRDAVVTVPAYFNHMQRSATKTAAELAGLNVLRIINEPTAAAIAFGLVKRYTGNRNILVYDFGGGTLDVTVLSINGNEFNVKASCGNTRLGGDDLTNRLVDYLVEYMKTEMGKDITNDGRAMNKLWLECENAKIDLSFRFEYTFFLDICGVTLKKKINRHKFVSLNKELFDKTMHYVEDAIKESKIEKKDINYVVPVGGSSKIPYVLEKLRNYFGEDVVKDDHTPDQVIAKGAAIYAAYLNGDSLQHVSEVYLSEVTPLSLGIEVKSKKASVIIKRNTKIPVTRSELYCTSYDYQDSVSLKVSQGEEEWFKDNEYLDEFWLDVTPKLEGKVKIDVEFSLDFNGLLRAKATEIGVGRSENTVIDLCGTLKKLDIQEAKSKLKKISLEREKYGAQQVLMHEVQTTTSEDRTSNNQQQAVQRGDSITRWRGSDSRSTTLELRKRKEE